MNSYDIGTVVRLRGTFKNAAGTGVDPGTVTVKIKSPSGTTTTYIYVTNVEVIREAAGSYYVDFEPTAQGVYVYNWKGTVSNKAAGETSFLMKETVFD